MSNIRIEDKIRKVLPTDNIIIPISGMEKQAGNILFNMFCGHPKPTVIRMDFEYWLKEVLVSPVIEPYALLLFDSLDRCLQDGAVKIVNLRF